jgi:hypothetical protein
MGSSSANRYGHRAELKAADRYRLDLDGTHTSWCDGRDRDGRPVEIKAARPRYSDGREGKFRVFEEYHDQLAARDGWYVFVLYLPRGTGVQVLDMDRRHSSRLPGSTWYGAGGHRDSRQREIQVSEVFG